MVVVQVPLLRSHVFADRLRANRPKKRRQRRNQDDLGCVGGGVSRQVVSDNGDFRVSAWVTVLQTLWVKNVRHTTLPRLHGAPRRRRALPEG